MKEQNQNAVLEIDHIIRQNLWFDFHVLSYDGNSLIIGGSTDLSISHTLEIVFDDVFFVKAYFEGWHTDTKNTVIEIPTGNTQIELNKKYEIEQGYQLFIIRTEDYKNDVYIAASRITYKTDTVKYAE
ncbi:hypothetical protein [Rufibacter sp. LB8]|uniref:hypothetical protein n=1 Tax=Rufibacter sp. LB8 TaxID=2777781 RepID=UPI00178C3D09|nr:hypothetical protein [Rufibacter sp. LB8]